MRILPSGHFDGNKEFSPTSFGAKNPGCLLLIMCPRFLQSILTRRESNKASYMGVINDFQTRVLFENQNSFYECGLLDTVNLNFNYDSMLNAVYFRDIAHETIYHYKAVNILKKAQASAV